MNLISIYAIICPLMTSIAGRKGLPDLTDDNFQNEALVAHNAYRAKHKDTPPMVIDATVVTYSKSRCDTVSQYEKLEEGHVGNQGSGYGENLYWGSNSLNITRNTSIAVQRWYDEIGLYSYSSPGFSSSTGHFTQIVWKPTTNMGCARCGGKRLEMYETYVTCNYKPAGNVMNQFHINVMPLCDSQCTSTNNEPTIHEPVVESIIIENTATAAISSIKVKIIILNILYSIFR